MKMSDRSPQPYLKAPILGQDNEDVSREMLATTADEIVVVRERLLVYDPNWARARNQKSAGSIGAPTAFIADRISIRLPAARSR